MALTKDTLMLFLLLMPGFLASIILSSIVARKSPEGMTLAIEAFVFSFVVYVLWGVVSGHFLFTVSIPDGAIHESVSPWSLVGVTLLSVLVSVAWGALLTRDVPFYLLAKMGVTKRTGRSSTWLDVFVEQQRYVVVNFTDGRRLFGWPEYYSDDPSEGMIYLSNPAWIDGEGNYLWLGVHGFLVSNRALVDSITFTTVDKTNVEFESEEYGKQSSATKTAIVPA